MLSGCILEMRAKDTKNEQNAPRSLSPVVVVLWEACWKEHNFLTYSVNEADSKEAVGLQGGILAMPPSGKTCSICPAGAPSYQLLLSFAFSIYHNL